MSPKNEEWMLEDDCTPGILDFTKSSEENFYDTVDINDFLDKDADIIYISLRKRMRLIPFADYLKRYIYIKSGMSGDYRNIDLREYQGVIVESFRENNTPASFSESSTRVSAAAKNWLTQASVKRYVVFLLGFGLNMSVDDVSSFLIKAQRERDFNFKDPNEIILWYCLKNRYKYNKAVQLTNQFQTMQRNNGSSLNTDRTLGIRDTFIAVRSDDELLNLLAMYNLPPSTQNTSATTWHWFKRLLDECKQIVAYYYNKDGDESFDSKSSKRKWSIENIEASDIEKILYSSTPIDGNGNLEKIKNSSLSEHFNKKRFTRQHITDLIQHKVAVDRFDLLTMLFFIFAQDESIANNKQRYSKFIDKVNIILNECFMGELYITNPYESFLLMCLLTDSPMVAYVDVWEKSFSEN